VAKFVSFTTSQSNAASSPSLHKIPLRASTILKVSFEVSSLENGIKTHALQLLSRLRKRLLTNLQFPISFPFVACGWALMAFNDAIFAMRALPLLSFVWILISSSVFAAASHESAYPNLAGAVTGGGLTVIANAPNPAGQSILSKYFRGGVSPLGLFLGALIPTIIMYLCFVFLPNGNAKEHPVDAPPAQEQVVPNH
jgi:hypothetical protein